MTASSHSWKRGLFDEKTPITVLSQAGYRFSVIQLIKFRIWLNCGG
nr:hypothetical protein [Psychrobacter sp. PraFG1]UNK04466.1 hypothetical protein MN210_08990 [Psychrobacter sp. PraFG1]